MSSADKRPRFVNAAGVFEEKGATVLIWVNIVYFEGKGLEMGANKVCFQLVDTLKLAAGAAAFSAANFFRETLFHLVPYQITVTAEFTVAVNDLLQVLVYGLVGHPLSQVPW